MGEITKDTILSKILRNSKKRKILKKYNFPCLTCPFARLEMEKLNLGEVCEMYGIDDEEIIKELNEIN
jgi:hypothetical protein